MTVIAADGDKHLVYAEDVIYELMQHPDNAIYKYELRHLVEKVVKEKGITTHRLHSVTDYYDDGDIYD
jgi:hypothetical protein